MAKSQKKNKGSEFPQVLVSQVIVQKQMLQENNKSIYTFLDLELPHMKQLT